MISSGEIKVKAEKKYIAYLRSIIEDIPFSRLTIPGNKNPPNSLQELQQEILDLVNNSKEKKGFGFTIDYQTIKTKGIIGTQSLPVSIYFDSETDLLKYLGKEKETKNFRTDLALILSQFSELKDWIIQNPIKIIQNHGKWESILKVCIYFKANSKPDLYIRELPISVDTKFIENNQAVLRDLLDILICTHINSDETEFEKRFNLKYREPLIRFKILDPTISTELFSGLNDISIPKSQFEKLNLPIKRVLIVENKTTLYTTLTLPQMTSTIAIFGQGNAVSNIQEANWLNKIEILYWGDIDVHGFEMLSLTRRYFNHTISFLMDETTFEIYFENEKGKPSTNTLQLMLTDEERNLYDKLKLNNWRLEQEKIPLEYVNKCCFKL